MARVPSGDITDYAAQYARKYGLGDNEVRGLTDSDISTLFEVRKDNRAAVNRMILRAIATALEEIGLRAEGYAKKLTPVDTGRLRNSITHVISGNDVYIGTNVEYAPYIEMGVSTWDGTGPKKAPKDGYQMLRKAASDHGEEYRDVLKKHLGG